MRMQRPILFLYVSSTYSAEEMCEKDLELPSMSCAVRLSVNAPTDLASLRSSSQSGLLYPWLKPL